MESQRDGFIEKGGKVTKYELKNWSGWYPSTIKTQFIRDLQGISNLEELKWVFNSTLGVNKGNMKGKILGTLKKADGSAVDELEALFNENPLAISEKYSTLFRREINSAEDIIVALEDDAIFNKLFKIAE